MKVILNYFPASVLNKLPAPRMNQPARTQVSRNSFTGSGAQAIRNRQIPIPLAHDLSGFAIR